MRKFRNSNGFSLIEVVLALGVVAIALVGIFSLFSSSMKTNRETTDRQEGLDLYRIVSSGLRDTNQVPDLARLADDLYAGTRGVRELFVCSVFSDGERVTLITNKSDELHPAPGSVLYHVSLNASSNLPTNVFPQPYSWPDWPALPVSVKVHAMPNAAARGILTNTPPVSCFEVVIPRS